MRRFPHAFAVAFALGAISVVLPAKSFAGCDPGTKLKGTTADEARKKIQAAGYTKVTNLSEGCDSAWHGKAVKDGKSTDVVLTPGGAVVVDGGTGAYVPPKG